MYDATIDDITGSEGAFRGAFGVERYAAPDDEFIMDADLPPVAKPATELIDPTHVVVENYKRQKAVSKRRAARKRGGVVTRACRSVKREWDARPLLVLGVIGAGVMLWAKRKK